MRWNETSLVSIFFFYFNAENVLVCVSSLFSDKVSTSWILEVHAVWLHMDESKSFCQHRVTGLLMLRDFYTISKLTVLQTQIEKLSQGRKFTKLDLRSAFLLVPLHKGSKKFLIINTPQGLYQFNCLSFGVKSAPCIYQCCMVNLFTREPHVVSYQDEILITGSSDAEHLDNLKKLSASGLWVRLNMCKFMAPSVTYLDHQIDLEGIHPTEDKIRTNWDAPAPHNVTVLKAFLGLFQFYSRYIPNIADKLSPLYCLLWKSISWRWETDCSSAFQQAKESLHTSCVLVHYDLKKELILTCNSSQYSMGTVLFHIMQNSSEKSVAYASWKLLAAEKNYSQLDKEGLSIIFLPMPAWTEFPDHYRLQTSYQSFQPVWACHQESSGGPCWWVHMNIALYTSQEKTLLLLTQWAVYLYKKICKSRHQDASFT